MTEHLLTPEEIAQELDIAEECSYEYSGGTLSTIDVYPLLQKQIAKCDIPARQREAVQGAFERIEKEMTSNFNSDLGTVSAGKYILNNVLQSLKQDILKEVKG